MPIKFNLRTTLQHILKKLQYRLAKAVAWLESDRVINPNAFDDLSPIDDVENVEVYNQALEWALANDRIKNIAVTGPYGSGKSSILKTFEKKHPGYHYLNVSLASFQDELKAADKDEMNRLIELSIIQQMFYRVKGSVIPDSRFNRIKNLSVWRVTYLSFFTVCLIIGLVIILFPDFPKRFSGWSLLNKQHSNLIICIALALTMPAFYNVLAYILRLLNTSKFNKINLTKGEVEFDSKSETSVLNRHLDEMLYFFEVTKYNVVMFEDLDRFNDPEIFTKLRELNILVNQSSQIGRHIVFIYAIKDDMFKDKTRTKFFDFIVPVIPVINWSNSFEIMMQKFGRKDLKLTISEKFISAVTLYIDDMRALKNIFNEFMLYKENLKGIALNQDKLLAIIVFKNIFPDDFAELHENRGIIYDVFAKKPMLINAVVEKNQQIILFNQSRIGQFHERLAADVLELRAIYLLAFQKLSPNSVALNIRNINVSFQDAQYNEEHFNWLTQQENIGIYHYVPHHYGGFMQQPIANGISFKMVENLVNKELSYKDRLAIIENKETAEVKKLNEENQKADQLTSNLKSFSLKELFDQNPDYLSSFKDDFKDRKLLVYLVREGYIDENYPSLISYFYQGSLTYRDMAFILSIRNRESLEFNYTLDKIVNILKRLEPEDFERRQILNFQMIDYLLRYKAKHQSHLQGILQRLSDQSADSLKFVDDYIVQGTEQEKFFSLLFNYWHTLWIYIYDNTVFANEQKNKYLKIIIAFADDEQLKKLNTGRKLEKYIKGLPNFLDLFKEPHEIKNVKALIKLLDIKFVKIIQPENSTELFDYIIINRHYMLNEDMIRQIIMEKGADESKNEKLITTANYTAVQMSKFLPLMDYVDDNLSDYVEAVTLPLPANINDTEEQLISLLNKTSLSDEIKSRLIDKEKAKIQNIQAAPQVIWEKLIRDDKIGVVWSNLVRYFELTGAIDHILIDYLNNKSIYEELSKHRSNEDKTISANVSVSFGLAWLQQNDLNDEAYEALLKNASHYFPSGTSVENLNERKVQALLNTRILRLTPESFSQVDLHFPQLTGLLIAKNIEGYFDVSAEIYPLKAKDFTFLLASTLITPAQKKLLIPRITESILDGNFPLLHLYIPEIIKDDYSSVLDASLLIVVMSHSEENTRRELINKYFSLFSIDEVLDLLPGLGEKYDQIQQNGEIITMKATVLDTSISKKLKEAGVISDWRGKKDQLLLYNNKMESGESSALEE